MLLEAIRVTGIFAFEGRQEIVAMMALGAAMKDGLIAEERWLAQDVEVADDACFAHFEMGFHPGRRNGFATRTATGFGPEPSNFNAVRIGQAMVTGDGDAFGQIDLDGEVGHDRLGQKGRRDGLHAGPAAAANVGTAPRLIGSSS